MLLMLLVYQPQVEGHCSVGLLCPVLVSCGCPLSHCLFLLCQSSSASLIRTLVITLRAHHTAKLLLSYKVTFTGSKNQALDLFGGHYSTSHSRLFHWVKCP